jgi:MFS family permease
MEHMATVPVPLLGQLVPWRVVFLVVGIPGILVALMSYAMPEPKRLGRLSTADQPRMGAVWGFIKSRSGFFTGHFIGFGFIHVFTYAMTAWLPTYVIRVFGWPIKDVALVLGACQLASIPSMLILGTLIERRFHRGGTDAHFAFYAVLILVSAALIIAAVVISDAWITIILFGLALSWLGYAGIAGAAMQLVTPNEFRGQVSVTYLFIATLIGVGIGPSIPAAFTDFLFHDDMKVGWSMGLTVAIAAPISAVFLWRGRPAMRRAVVDAQAWSHK